MGIDPKVLFKIFGGGQPHFKEHFSHDDKALNCTHLRKILVKIKNKRKTHLDNQLPILATHMSLDIFTRNVHLYMLQACSLLR